MARAVSTVLDVAVCLLLVGAAIGTITVAPQSSQPSEAPDAGRTTATVASVTTTVPVGAERQAHATVAGHLGTAAVADARLDGDPVAGSSYPSAVANETRSVTPDRTYVTARWEPYPGAPLAGTVSAGEHPPGRADVAASRITVDNGIAEPGRLDSFEDLARSLANAYVAWLFPPERTYANLVDDRTAGRTRDRYSAVGQTVAVAVRQPLLEGQVRVANDDLSSTLAARFEADLRDRYPSPKAAASNVTVDEVDIVVRRWEP